MWDGSSSHSLEAVGMKEGDYCCGILSRKPGVSLQVKVCAVTMAAGVLVNPIVASSGQPAKSSPFGV